MNLKFVMKNLEQFKNDLDKSDKNRLKAAETATKVEGFRLSKILKEEILAGAPGGQVFAPLSEIAKQRTRDINRKPLARLAIPVRYATNRDSGNYTVSIGFLDLPGRGRSLSKSWKRIAEIMQEGFTTPVSEELRKRLAIFGAKRKERKEESAKYFFLRQSTTQLKTPARAIIEPFWKAHESEISRNITSNFERKFRGERI